MICDVILANKLDIVCLCRQSISQMMNATRPVTDEGETQVSYSAEAFEQHLSIMKEVHEKIEEIEVLFIMMLIVLGIFPGVYRISNLIQVKVIVCASNEVI